MKLLLKLFLVAAGIFVAVNTLTLGQTARALHSHLWRSAQFGRGGQKPDLGGGQRPDDLGRAHDGRDGERAAQRDGGGRRRPLDLLVSRRFVREHHHLSDALPRREDLQAGDKLPLHAANLAARKSRDRAQSLSVSKRAARRARRRSRSGSRRRR